MIVQYQGQPIECVEREVYAADVQVDDFIMCEHFGVSRVVGEPEIEGRLVGLPDHMHRTHTYNVRNLVKVFRPVANEEEVLTDTWDSDE